MGGRHYLWNTHALRQWIERTESVYRFARRPLVQGKLVGKAGGAFTSTSTTHGGNESTLLSLYNPMAHLGLIIVPLGYGDPIMFRAGTPYGASTVSGQKNAPPTADDLEVARYQGWRIAQVATALKAARLTETK